MTENETKRRPKSFVSSGRASRTQIDPAAAGREPKRAMRAVPSRSSIAVERTCTRLSVSSIQSTGTSWMRRAVALGEQQELGVEEPPVVLDRGKQARRDVAAHGLEAALRVTDTRGQHRAQDQVVGCGR